VEESEENDDDDGYIKKKRKRKCQAQKSTPRARDDLVESNKETEGLYEEKKFLALYGSDNEGSLYDHRSDKFNMLRFPNILPQVTHRYSETVSGVTTPMLYIAQKFAPFPPHVEDNEAWSINYLHRGNPKIWLAKLFASLLTSTSLQV